jgi:hypothetical protein
MKQLGPWIDGWQAYGTGVMKVQRLETPRRWLTAPIFVQLDTKPVTTVKTPTGYSSSLDHASGLDAF